MDLDARALRLAGQRQGPPPFDTGRGAGQLDRLGQEPAAADLGPGLAGGPQAPAPLERGGDVVEADGSVGQPDAVEGDHAGHLIGPLPRAGGDQPGLAGERTLGFRAQADHAAEQREDLQTGPDRPDRLAGDGRAGEPAGPQGSLHTLSGERQA